METWKTVWRQGIAPQCTDEQLQALALALECDYPELIQGATCEPAPLFVNFDLLCQCACPIGFLGWKTGMETVGQVEEFFARTCFNANQALGEPAAVRWFMNWVDETPREKMRQGLLAEVQASLAERAGMVPSAA